MKKILYILWLVAAPLALHASTYYVKTSAAGDSTGNNWSNAMRLKSALDIAANGDSILVWQGSYTIQSLIPGTGCAPHPFTIGDGVHFYGSFSDTNETDSTRSFSSWSHITGDLNANNSVDIDEHNTLLEVLPATDSITVIDGFYFQYGQTALDASEAHLRVARCHFLEFNGTSGVVNDHGGDASYRNCTFHDNDLSGHGAVLRSRLSDNTFTNCSFYDNTKTGHKTIFGSVLLADTTTVKFINCAFRNNTTDLETAFGQAPVGSELHLINCTYYGNELDNTEALVEVLEVCTVLSTIARYDDVIDHLVSTTESGGFQMDYSIAPAGYTGPGYNNAGMVTTDPNINTTTLKLQSGSSSAVDAGLHSLAVNPELYDEDLDGEERLQNHTSCVIDMGAYEFVATPCSAKVDQDEQDIETQLSVIGIYPNPTRGEVTIRTEESIRHITVRDLAGRVVLNHQYADDENFTVNLDLSHQPPGYYLLQIGMGQRSELEKIVVQ